MIGTIIIILILASFTDVLIKEKYVKERLWLKKYKGDWSALPNFWKDGISNDKFYRIRWVYVLMSIFITISFLECGWQGMVLFLYLSFINSEHILYQWIAGFLVKDKKLFDLTDVPAWMDALPLNKLLRKHHKAPMVTSEEIYTINYLGLIFLFLFIKFI